MIDDRVFAACPSGPPAGARRRRLAEAGGGVPLGVWAVDLLSGQVDPDDGVWAMTRERPAVWQAAAALAAGRGLTPVLSVTAGRYLAVSGTPGVYDATDGLWLDRLPPDVLDGWFETRVFNLRTLARACAARAAADTPKPEDTSP